MRGNCLTISPKEGIVNQGEKHSGDWVPHLYLSLCDAIIVNLFISSFACQ